MPDEYVSNHRLGADQKLIRKNIPWPNGKPPGPNVIAKSFLIFRVNLEVVLQNHRLPIEQEMLEL